MHVERDANNCSVAEFIANLNLKMKIIPAIRTLIAGACAALLVTQLAAADSPREHLSLDANWKFHLGDDWPDALHLENSGTGSGPASEKFSDSYWRVVNLPHDWAVELPFDWAADGSHGFKTLGVKYPTNSIAWYRRTFELPKDDEGKRIWLTFDGVFRDATVWVNGWCVRHHEGGYYPFREDITDVVHFGGKNTIAVRVDATKSEGWFYEGAGIYRHVWLDKTAPVAIAPDGIFVQSEFENNIPQGSPEIKVEVSLLNTHDQRRESDGELRNHFARRQIAEAIFRIGKVEAQIAGHREIGNETFLAGSLVAGIAETLQTRHHRFSPTAKSLTKRKPRSASAPWALTRRTAFC